MTDEIILVIIGTVMSALGFLVIKWMKYIEHKLRDLDESTNKLKDGFSDLSHRVKTVEDNTIKHADCLCAKNSLQQELIREHSRVDTLADRLKYMSPREVRRVSFELNNLSGD